MADKIPTPEEIAAHNKAVTEKVAAQDAVTTSLSDPTGDASDSLDALMKQADEKAKAAAAAAPEVTPAPAPADDEAAKAAAAEAKAKEEADAVAKAKADEVFKDSPALPPGASPKSHEAFATIKIKAAQDISDRDAKIAELEKSVAELKEAKPSAEQEASAAELEELRSWRKRLDIDFDPAFKSYDAKVARAREFVYAQLRKSPVITEEVIDQIKKFGGPDKANLSKVFEKMGDPTLKSVIEGQISDILKVTFEKDEAIKSAKDNLKGYLGQREKELSQVSTKHLTGTQSELNNMLGSLEWWKPVTPKADADPAAKKAAEEHNKFLTEAQEQMKEALADDSPRMRALLITGTLQLFNLQRVHDAVKAELVSVKKQLEDTTAKWTRVKEAGRTKLNESAAPAGGSLPKSDGLNVTVRSSDALDAIAKQVMDERAAKLGSRG